MFLLFTFYMDFSNCCISLWRWEITKGYNHV